MSSMIDLESMIYAHATDVYKMRQRDARLPPVENVRFGPIDYSQLQVEAQDPKYDGSLKSAAQSGTPLAQTVEKWSSSNDTSNPTTKKISAKFENDSTATISYRKGVTFGKGQYGVPLPLTDDDVRNCFGVELKLTGKNVTITGSKLQVSMEETITIPSRKEVTASVVNEIRQYETDFKIVHVLRGNVRVPVFRADLSEAFLLTIDDINLHEVVQQAPPGGAIQKVKKGISITTEGALKCRFTVNHRVETTERDLPKGNGRRK